MMWHADEPMLAQYAAGALDDPRTASVEAHVLDCEPCRARLSRHVSIDRHNDVWAGVIDRLDAPAATPLERFLLALRVPDHIARLLVATPALRMSWVGGVAAALVFVALAGSLSGDPRVLPLFLILAPIIPVAGVAVSYGPHFDPAAELSVAAAMDSFRLLLLRALAILAVTTPLSALTAIVLPAGGWRAAAWLLPAVALTSMTLALGRVLALHAAAALVGSAWIVVALASVNPVRPAVAAVFAAFEPAGQAVSLVVTVVSAVFLFGRDAPARSIPRRP